MTSRYDSDLDKANREIKYFEDKLVPLKREEDTLRRDVIEYKRKLHDEEERLRRVETSLTKIGREILEINAKIDNFRKDAMKAQAGIEEERRREQSKR